MSDIIRRHVSQFPHARATTIQYLAKRDEMTERLRRELGMEKQDRKPWWERALSAALRGRM